jgi:hypothetical protein
MGWSPTGGTNLLKNNLNQNKMKTLLMGLILLLVYIGPPIIIIIVVYNIVTRATNDTQSYYNHADSMVGKKVSVGNDTLLILDYSTVNQNYTLDNGTKIDMSLADKNVIK